jgi:hypothetical protein
VSAEVAGGVAGGDAGMRYLLFDEVPGYVSGFWLVRLGIYTWSGLMQEPACTDDG